MRPLPDSSRRQFDDLIAVIESTRALSSAADIPEAMSLFARELTLLFNASACMISSYDAESQAVTDWAAYVVPPATLNVVAEDYSLADYPATLRVLTELRSAATTAGDGGDPAEHAFLAEMGFKASMMTPLVMGAQAVGLIELFDMQARVFTADDMKFCRLLSDQAGIVLGTAQLAERLEEQHLATVAALAAALEAKDAYTGRHAQTISDLAQAVGEELGLSRPRAAGHPDGRSAARRRQDRDPRVDPEQARTADRRRVQRMKRHTLIGADIISSIPGMEEVVGAVRSSRALGRPRLPGRPAGNEVPRGAYVIAACDAYHAMTEDRVYRKAMSIELACQDLRRCSGSQFMPAAVDALIAVVERGEALRRVVYQSQAA